MYWLFIFIIVNSHVVNTITLLTISQHSANHIISHPTSFYLQQLSKHHSQYSSKKQYNQWKVTYMLNTPKCPQSNQKRETSTQQKKNVTKQKEQGFWSQFFHTGTTKGNTSMPIYLCILYVSVCVYVYVFVSIYKCMYVCVDACLNSLCVQMDSWIVRYARIYLQTHRNWIQQTIYIHSKIDK